MRIALLAAILWCSAAGRAQAAEPGKVDAKFPFRTDWANQQLSWYQLKPGEFPPHHSDHRVGGELVAADFLHRSGRFRVNGSGELVDFTMPPFGTISYLNAEAELRDVPLGTFFLFFLHQDESGAFTRVATMQDEYSMLANHGFTYRLSEIRLADGKLRVTKQKLSENKLDEGHDELPVNERTRVWKGDRRMRLSDLALDDVLLVNVTGESPQHPRRCTDIWVGAETHAQVTQRQRKQHIAFLKERGLPAWIDHIEGRKLTVTLFGDRDGMRDLLKEEGVVPATWAAEHRVVEAVVANHELRTYNPPVDKQRCTVVELQQAPTDCYGCSGERWVIEADLLLEGFRVGRVIRLFVSPSWPVKDMPFGEGMYDHAIEANDEDPQQYPYRLDSANQQLPWYRLKPGEFPPNHSEHRVAGELVQVDAGHRSGRFRNERSGELVDFTMPAFASVSHLAAEAELDDVPLGTRCWFSLYQDAGGAFTQVAAIADDYTIFANAKFSYRIDEVFSDEQSASGAANRSGTITLLVARQAEPVTNYNGDQVRPPDLGRGWLALDGQTRIWKGDHQVTPGDLAVGDELLVNRTGITATSAGRCSDIWIGAETHRLASERQRSRHRAFIRERGMPAWIERVEGGKLTITFFAGIRADFPALMDGDPWGKSVFVIAADDALRPRAPAADKAGFVNHLPEGPTAATYGCSGVRWVIEPAQLTAAYRPGAIVRVFKEGWPIAIVANGQAADPPGR